MKIKTSIPCSSESVKSKHTYKIKDQLEVIVHVTSNPLNLPMDELFLMAARINKKRSFLFVSKVLGKHIPVNPHVSLLGGAALAVLLQQESGGPVSVDLPEIVQAIRNPAVYAADVYASLKRSPLLIDQPHLFIGFAETATALGHSMYEVFSGPTRYLHTTRESIRELDSILSFEEEHSHATAHRCYARDERFFQGTQPVVLVDDEITTGKTALNMIRDLHMKFPRSKYIVASLLDWRSDADREQFTMLEAELDIEIVCLSLIEGQIEVHGSSIEYMDEAAPSMNAAAEPSTITKHYVYNDFDHMEVSSGNSLGDVNLNPYVSLTGRFGLQYGDNSLLDKQVQQSAAFLGSLRTGANTLCIGTGEFMYVPMRIAAAMGDGILYQSTTRSPIHPSQEVGYAIRYRDAYTSPEDPAVMNFLYNIPPGHYDELFVFMEREASSEAERPFVEALRRTHTPHIHLVYFSPPVNEVDKELTS
ncbi:phosphoribosyltransferase family protein [Paenibacillus sp. WQ 127069]|uniref:Phosphoribosyltransferase family protein n=1 Tax=Paenibacillus baimaensis TaxID=2982185 RepID=A0ABT2UHK8_9BACL|nr:phosphoribosyltransferase family protein [Paenibacillus sp. WQ 127069]MCU6794132.1 phosphoribosyltransferase family protein [Paenibacillus sp. WQ 127069]